MRSFDLNIDFYGWKSFNGRKKKAARMFIDWPGKDVEASNPQQASNNYNIILCILMMKKRPNAATAAACLLACLLCVFHGHSCELIYF